MEESLSEEQISAFNKFKKGENLLILGRAGCGKSFLIKFFKQYAPMDVDITSTTGVSAYNIHGTTIHSLIGIGTGEKPVETYIKNINKDKNYRNNILGIKILIIDEISMLSAEIFEKMNEICKSIRKNNIFFGGIQVILLGDFLQLEAVFNKNDKIFDKIDKRLLIESNTFNQVFNNTNDNIIELKTNFRQNNIDFDLILSRLRTNNLNEKDLEILNNRNKTPESTDDVIHLVSTNKKAQTLNFDKMELINDVTLNYIAQFITTGRDKQLKEILLKEIKKQITQKGVETLKLKRKTRVMLIKNTDIRLGLVNGSTGSVIELDPETVTVRFDNNIVYRFNKQNISSIELNDCSATCFQIPLILAYSLTIHKCQGITLNKAIIDISNIFSNHQLYVAISRVKTLDGIFLSCNINSKKILVNNKVINYMKNLADTQEKII